MMMSPENYINQMKNYSIEQLIDKRKELIAEISNYEDNYVLKKQTNIQPIIESPSPDTKYKMNNEYLKALVDLIIAKLANNQNKINFNNNQSVDELIKKVSGPDPFWQNSIKKYFDNLDKTDEEKIIFLQNISLDKQVFNDFTKEINSVSNPNDLFNKYKEKIMNNNRFMTNKGEFKKINDDELKNKNVETYAEWED